MVVVYCVVVVFSSAFGIASVWASRDHIGNPVDLCIFFTLGFFWLVTLPLAWWITRRGK